MTLYRRVGDVVWRVVPEGMRVPRVDGTQEAEAARLVRECTANMISCRDYLFAGLPGSKDQTLYRKLRRLALLP